MSASAPLGYVLELPRELDGDLGILLVLLEPEQEREIRNWIPYIKQIEQLQEHLCYYVSPVLGQTNAIGRTVKRVFDSHSWGPLIREHLMPLPISADDISECLHLGNAGGPWILLLDRLGQLWWRAEGKVTPEKIQHLAEAIERARAASQCSD